MLYQNVFSLTHTRLILSTSIYLFKIHYNSQNSECNWFYLHFIYIFSLKMPWIWMFPKVEFGATIWHHVDDIHAQFLSQRQQFRHPNVTPLVDLHSLASLSPQCLDNFDFLCGLEAGLGRRLWFWLPVWRNDVFVIWVTFLLEKIKVDVFFLQNLLYGTSFSC